MTAEVLARLAAIGVESLGGEYEEAWSRLAMLRGRRQHVAELFARGDLDAQTFSLASRATDSALRGVEADLLTADHENLRLGEVPFGDRDAIGSFWGCLGSSQRQSYLRFFFGRVIVASGSPGRSVDPARVSVAWAR